MKIILIVFLQVVIVLIGILLLSILIYFPLTEGRATNLDLISIYIDPFLLYEYATSIVFFVALYEMFKLVGYIEQNKIFSPYLVKTLKNIKYYAILLSVLILLAGVYIKLFHNKKDDPAGFLSICMVITFSSIVVATIAAKFERRLQNVINMKF